MHTNRIKKSKSLCVEFVDVGTVSMKLEYHTVTNIESILIDRFTISQAGNAL